MQIDDRWSGMLTIENTPAIADKIRKLLSGKEFTFVTCSELFDYKPEIRVNQTLKNSTTGDLVSIYVDENKRLAGFNACDSYGVWGCSTNLKEDTFDPRYKNPHIEFSYEKITITFRAPAGWKIYWVIRTNKS